MRRMNPLLFLSFLPLLAAGCERQLSKPEIKTNLLPIEQTMNVKPGLVPVFNPSRNEIPALFVSYETKGKQVFVECQVTGISFRNADNDRQKAGKMVVWVDGIRRSEVRSAAFIIKDLSPGKHRLRLEVVSLQNEPFGLSKQMMVIIPK
ncbi:hypothetical protein V7128_15030 [Neobacillus vireti]|uniref:hypothetical protein n=1 Tax=Neobacillus vireti TaxID=220686 RepID=UPI003000D25F